MDDTKRLTQHTSSRPANQASSSSFRFFILVLLMVQNASHGLVAKYSTSVLNESYSSSELVLVSELIKLIVCTYLSINDKTESGSYIINFLSMYIPFQ